MAHFGLSGLLIVGLGFRLGLGFLKGGFNKVKLGLRTEFVRGYARISVGFI